MTCYEGGDRCQLGAMNRILSLDNPPNLSIHTSTNGTQVLDNGDL